MQYNKLSSMKIYVDKWWEVGVERRGIAEGRTMRRLFMVEADTRYDSLFCYELNEGVDGHAHDKEGDPIFTRVSDMLFNKVDREVFFGTLNSLCVTRQDPEEHRMTLVAPPTGVVAEQMAAVERCMAPAEPLPDHVKDFLAAPVPEVER